MNANKEMQTQSTNPGSLCELIAGHPFLKGLSQQHLLAILAEYAMAADFKKDELIFREGDPANRFYLIRQGQVELETEIKDRGRMLIQTIGPGDVLGWSWLFEPYYWHFDARAVSPVKAIFFYGTPLRQRCEEDHHLGYELMKRVAEVVIKRLQGARKHLIEIGDRA